jgi:hypothetical protein
MFKIVFNKINEEERTVWGNLIRSAFYSLPGSHKAAIPPVHIYNSMTEALCETFDPDNEFIDTVAEDYLKSKVWGFSYLCDSSARNPKIPAQEYQRIVLAIGRRFAFNEFPSPEFTVFHEFGHFYLQKVKNIIICKNNEKEVEHLCDRYAIESYVRLLCKNPGYRTLSSSKAHISFENLIRDTANTYCEDFTQASYKTAANRIVIKLKWDLPFP